MGSLGDNLSSVFQKHVWQGLPKATGSSSASGILGTPAEWLQSEEAKIDGLE
jgi:hypothetical protein